MAKPTISAQQLRERLAYDPDTGLFTWAAKVNSRVEVGAVAGSKHSDGYIRIQVLGRDYYAHRLAWLFVHGEWPSAEIDHLDGNRERNAIANLRDVPQAKNQQNQRRAQSSSGHGFMGCCRSRNKWVSGIWVEGKRRHLGTFDTPELAHAAYIEAKRLRHPGCMI